MKDALRYYDQQGGDGLAKRFYTDLMARFKEIEEQPQSFAFYLSNRLKRRARYIDSLIGTYFASLLIAFV